MTAAFKSKLVAQLWEQLPGEFRAIRAGKQSVQIYVGQWVALDDLEDWELVQIMGVKAVRGAVWS